MSSYTNRQIIDTPLSIIESIKASNYIKIIIIKTYLYANLIALKINSRK